MTDSCVPLLDACPGALGLFDPEFGLRHVNPRLAALCPELHPGMDWPALMAAVGGPGEDGPRADPRFTVGQGDRLTGLQLSAFVDHDRELFLISATAVAARRWLKQGLAEILEVAANGMLDRRPRLPSGKGMAQQVGDILNLRLDRVREQVVELAAAVSRRPPASSGRHCEFAMTATARLVQPEPVDILRV